MWYYSKGHDSDVVVSSRIRLARNLKELPFTPKLSPEQGEKVLELSESALNNLPGKFLFRSKDDLDVIELQALVEKHLISPEMLQSKLPQGVILSEDETVSIMVNEEDHIRIQCLGAGLNLDELWKNASGIDDILNTTLDFAFDEMYGYLTCCPTNLGTGLRASVMLHLPATAITKTLGGLANAVTKLGIAVRGLYGEGTEGFGNFYQFSNQITLGKPEEEFISDLKHIVLQVISHEKNMRENLLSKEPDLLKDKIMRSYGIMKYATMISSDEFLKLLSDLRLGVTLGIIEDITIEQINKLMILSQPANLMLQYGKDTAPRDRDLQRTRIIRKTLFENSEN